MRAVMHTTSYMRLYRYQSGLNILRQPQACIGMHPLSHLFSLLTLPCLCYNLPMLISDK